MVKKMLVFLLFFLAYSYLITPIAYADIIPAQFSQAVKDCLAKRENYFRCDSYLNDVKTCLDAIPETDTTWSCNERTDGIVVDNPQNLEICSGVFANNACYQIGGISNFLKERSCQDICDTGDFKKNFSEVFQKKYKFQKRIGITPTPAPVPGSVIQQDTCLPLASSSLNCNDNMHALFNCFKDSEGASEMWSCTTSSGEELDSVVCREAFTRRIKSKMMSTIGEECTANYKYDKTGKYQVSYEGFKKLFDDMRIKRNYRDVTPTPGVVDEWLYKDLIKKPDVSDVEHASDVLNCGFANADSIEKTRCCPQDIDLVSMNPVDTTGLEDCAFRFLGACVGNVTKLTEMMRNSASNMLISTTGELQQVIAENDGVLPKCFIGECVADPTTGFDRCQPEKGAALCYQYIDEDAGNNEIKELTKCTQCMEDNLKPGKPKKIYTSIGCIDTSIGGIIAQVFSMGIGIAGLIAFGCIVYSAFLMQMSQGNPEQIQKAQENITSCITGLILIILSIFILRVIGVDILRIPGFT